MSTTDSDTTDYPYALDAALTSPGVTVTRYQRHPRTYRLNELDVRIHGWIVYVRAIVREGREVWVCIRLTDRPDCWQYLDTDGWVDGIAPHDPRAAIGFCEQRAALTWDSPEEALRALSLVRPDAPSFAYRSPIDRVNDFDGRPAPVCAPGFRTTQP